MKTIEINFEIVANLINSADWDYQYCSPERVLESDMREYIYELEESLKNSPLTAEDCEKFMTDESGFFGELGERDINKFCATWIADSIARSRIDNLIYTSVTFEAMV